jgi:hypothetical protein
MLWFDGFMNGCVFANLKDTVLNFRVNDDFYNRRNGWKRAKQMLRDRLKINKALGYDISANLFAFAISSSSEILEANSLAISSPNILLISALISIDYSSSIIISIWHEKD